MKYVTIISLLLSITIFAQEKAKTDDGRIVILNPNGTWQYDTTASVISQTNYSIPEKRTFKHPPFSTNLSADYFLEEKYDKFKDITSVNIILKLNQHYSNLSIGAFFLYKGSQVETPSHLTLRFVSNSKDWKYLRNSKIIFLVDGKRIDLGEMKRDGRVGSGYVLEFLTKIISTDTFLEIINGSDVEGKLFTTEFKLTEEQLEAFRDFASRMQ